MPAIATGHVMQTTVHTSRIRSGAAGKVATAKSAQKPASKKPAMAHIAIRYLMAPPPHKDNSTPLAGYQRGTQETICGLLGDRRGLQGLREESAPARYRG